MADKLPSFGVSPSTPNKPKRLLYQQKSWTLPASQGFDQNGKNKFDQTWEDIFGQRETAALMPDHEKAVVSRARSKSLAVSIAARYGEEIEK